MSEETSGASQPARYWIEQLQRSSTGDGRWHDAIEALQLVGRPAAAELIAVLDHPSIDVTRGVRKALKGIGPAMLPQLGEALCTSRPIVRLAAAMVFHAMGADAAPAIESLIAALQDEDYCVRQWAAGALGAMGTAALPALPALMRSIEQEGDETALEWMRLAVERIEWEPYQ